MGVFFLRESRDDLEDNVKEMPSFTDQVKHGGRGGRACGFRDEGGGGEVERGGRRGRKRGET